VPKDADYVCPRHPPLQVYAHYAMVAYLNVVYFFEPYRISYYDAFHEGTYISITCGICGYRLCSS
jgi:hypothetical protein